MKTHLMCRPCFQRQARYAASLATDCVPLQTEIMAQAEGYLATLDMDESPPVNAMGLYSLLSKISRNPDPFVFLKQQSNLLALEMRSRVEAMINEAGDPLYRAILFAIAGNIIDYGSQQTFDLDATMANCLNSRPIIDDYQQLQRDLGGAKQILYLADNCGEIVFDSLLADRLSGAVTMVVKDGPIINDATAEDATLCGISQRHRVITNGAVCPGTPLALCSKELQSLFAEADVVISKGQGNFETLSEEKRPVYHLLTVKCPVVANHIEELSGYPRRIPPGIAVLLKLGE